ncbi:AMP-binding protein [Kitasatospora sp. NPDC051914]|uniref:AMP-binding protein n=1 Tax=Kitasatospora sp. NPDC051914 TaxID=3154945 RepID=UPI00343517E6
MAADRTVTPLSCADLARRSNRFANALRTLGVGRGERVASLLGRCPELYVSVPGTLKNASVFCPLFPAFGPVPALRPLAVNSAVRTCRPGVMSRSLSTFWRWVPTQLKA